jgi:hypothetical protein
MSNNISFTVTISQNPTTIVLPVTGVTSIDIEWGDGTNELGITSDYPTHTYTSISSFTISLNGIFTRLNNQSSPDPIGYNNCLRNFSYYNQISSLTSFANAFQGVTTNFTLFFAPNVTNNVTSMEAMFFYCTAFTASAFSLSDLNTDANQRFDRMFEGCFEFNQPISFDVRAATTVFRMFRECLKLNSPITLTNTSLIKDFGSMFENCSSFNQPISFDTSAATTFQAMFIQCTSLNSSVTLTNTELVTSFNAMFAYCKSFNQPLTLILSQIDPIDFESMFLNALSFNSPITFLPNTSKVASCYQMFAGATNFNQDISDWIVTSLYYGSYLLDATSFSTENYNKLLNSWAAQRPNLLSGVDLGVGSVNYSGQAIISHNILTSNPYNWIISDGGSIGPIPPPPCFKEDTKILTNKGYIPVQDLKKGDLVKTLLHDFKPIDIIGKKEINHIASKERIKNQLYIYSKDKVEEVLEPLIITGCHSVLVDEFINFEQREKSIEINGRMFSTDDKYRLPACADERASVYEIPGTYTIYHFALENDDYYMNYGVFANGLLVETCSKRYLKELSGMTIL